MNRPYRTWPPGAGCLKANRVKDQVSHKKIPTTHWFYSNNWKSEGATIYSAISQKPSKTYTTASSNA